MPFGLGPTELIVILLIVLLLFGAKRIPEIAGSLGKGINSFKRNLSEVEGNFREGVRDASLDAPARRDPLPAADPLTADRPAALPQDDAERPGPKRLLS